MSELKRAREEKERFELLVIVVYPSDFETQIFGIFPGATNEQKDILKAANMKFITDPQVETAIHILGQALEDEDEEDVKASNRMPLPISADQFVAVSTDNYPDYPVRTIIMHYCE